jgi:hypothetical protein
MLEAAVEDLRIENDSLRVILRERDGEIVNYARNLAQAQADHRALDGTNAALRTEIAKLRRSALPQVTAETVTIPLRVAAEISLFDTLAERYRVVDCDVVPLDPQKK